MAQSRQPTLSPSNTQPDSKIECSSIGHITNTSRNLSRSFSKWRRAAANPNSADNPKSALTNHIRGAYISHHQSKWRRAAATPHSARQPQSAFINKTQRQHLPPPISMAARSRPTHTQADCPKSAFINKTQRQHLPPPISMAAHSRQPTLSSTTQNHNHQSDKAITYSTTTINGGAKPPNPHLARQPKSALIDQTQRQYIPRQISMAARSRPPTISPTAQKSAFITHTRR